MFALLAHLTMEEEPFIALAVGLGAVIGGIGTALGIKIGRRRQAAEVRNES